MQSTLNIEAEWRLCVEKYRKRLRKRKHLDLIQHVDYQSFQDNLVAADVRYRKNKISRQLQALKPACDQLNYFVGAINQVVSAHPEVAGFVWGGTQALIVAASKYVDLLSTITEMIHELASLFGHLQCYLCIFPQSPDLQECTKCLIDDYVSFTITAWKFFDKWPLYNLLRMFWSTVDSRFRQTKDSISKTIVEFQRKRDYLVDSTLINNQRQILNDQRQVITTQSTLLSGQRQILAAFPSVAILPAQAQKFYDVPLSQDPYFSERDKELKFIQTSLTRDPENTIPRQMSCLVQGIGGSGKTLLAVEYSYRHRAKYDYIFFLDAETEPKLSSGAALCCKKLGLDPAGNSGQRLQAERFRTWLEMMERPWLLILDNAEEVAKVDFYWPKSTHGCIIVTSQNSQFSRKTFSTLSLKSLDVDAGSNLLLKHLRTGQGPFYNTDTASEKRVHLAASSSTETDSRIARLISAEVDGLPLALAQIAGSLQGSTMEELWKMLQERPSATKILLREDTSPFQYNKKWSNVWDVALQKLTTPSALRLIQVLAMLDPTGVPESMLFTKHEEASLSFLKITDLVQFNALITNIKSRQLVDREQMNGRQMLTMHRMVQWNILFHLDKDVEEFARIFRIAFTLVRKVFPKQSPVQAPQNHLWDVWEQYSSQVMNLRSVYAQSGRDLPMGIEFAEMLSDVSEYFWERNMFNDGYLASSTAESICDKLGNGLLTEKANVYSIAGAVRCNHGISERAGSTQRWIKSLLLRQEALHALKQASVTNQDMLLYINPWNDIGWALLEYDCYEEAHIYFELAWEVKKVTELHQFSHFPTSELNISIALAGQGKYEDAISLITNAITSFEEKMRANNTEVEVTEGASALELHFTLSFILLSARKYDEAFEEARGVYERRSQLLGPSSRGTLDACYILATAQQYRGNLESAAALLGSIFTRPYDWTEESAARAQFRLSVILSRCHRTKEANAYEVMAKSSLKDLWLRHATDMPDYKDLEAEVAFDHLVALGAGRSTLGKFCAKEQKHSELHQICDLLVKRLAVEPEKSAQRLWSIFQLGDNTAWIKVAEKLGRTCPSLKI